MLSVAALLVFTSWRSPYPHAVIDRFGSGEMLAVVAPLKDQPGAMVRAFRPKENADLQAHWSVRLPVYPSLVFLADSGAMVAIGPYPSYGPKHALMIVSPGGTLLADLDLERFLPKSAYDQYKSDQAKVEGLYYACWLKPAESVFQPSTQFVKGFLPDEMRHRDPQNLSEDILMIRMNNGGQLAVDAKSGKVAVVSS